MSNLTFAIAICASFFYGSYVGYNHGFKTGIIQLTDLILELKSEQKAEDIRPYHGGKI